MTYQHVAVVAILGHFLAALGTRSWASLVIGALLCAAYRVAYRRTEEAESAATEARARRAKGKK